MTKRATAACVLTLATVLVGGCTSGGGGSTPTDQANVGLEQRTTAAATKPLAQLSWYGDYRPPYTLDPIKVADYPEETVLPNVCEGLLRPAPDDSLQPGLASAFEQGT